MTKTLATLLLFLGSAATAQSLPTVTTIAVSANPTQGKPVTVTTTTTANGAKVNGGNMTLSLNGVAMGTVAVNGSGVAKFTATPATAGKETLTASFTPHYGASSSSESITITAATGCVGQACGSTTPAPSFSVAAGAVSPGTTTTPSCTGSGCVIFYTWDGSTPGYTTGPNGDLYGTGTTMQYRPSYVSSFAIYTPMTFKAIAHVTGQPDSSVTTAAYTLTAATGTAVSACGTLSSASTTYYLTTDLSASGTCLYVAANAIHLNLNGHTITYGTGDSPLVNVTTAVANGTTTVTGTGVGASCTPGNRAYVVQTGSGAYQNTQTTIATCNSSTQITLHSAVSFSQTGAQLITYGPNPSYGVDIDQAVTGSPALNFVMFNGTVNQANVNAYTPSTNSANINIGNTGGYNDNQNTVLAGLTGTVYGPEAQCEVINYGLYGNTMEFSVCNNNSTKVFNRDNLDAYSMEFQNGEHIAAVTPLSNAHDLIMNGGPQGGFEAQMSGMQENNYDSCGTSGTQYVNGYGSITVVNNETVVGNTIAGNCRGIDVESNNVTVAFNNVNTTDAYPVLDPNHNPPGCEDGGNRAMRSRDNLGSLTGETINDNWMTANTGSCTAQVQSFTQVSGTDGGPLTNNAFILNMAGNVTPSGVYFVDGSNMAGYTIGSSNVTSITGTYASAGSTLYASYDGMINMVLSGLLNPRIYNAATVPTSPASSPTTATLTGTGTATCTHAGGVTSNNITFNAVAVPCP